MTINLHHNLAVEATGLVKRFSTFAAVEGVDLAVRTGEIFGVLGPNGAGKTTTLKMLATLLPIDGGRATIFGVDVAAHPHQIRQLVGVTGQYASVDEDLTGQENLWLFGRLQGLSSKAAKATVSDLLTQFGLEDAANWRVQNFSGGMRRRLDLAWAVLGCAVIVGSLRRWPSTRTAANCEGGAWFSDPKPGSSRAERAMHAALRAVRAACDCRCPRAARGTSPNSSRSWEHAAECEALGVRQEQLAHSLVPVDQLPHRQREDPAAQNRDVDKASRMAARGDACYARQHLVAVRLRAPAVSNRGGHQRGRRVQQQGLEHVNTLQPRNAQAANVVHRRGIGRQARGHLAAAEKQLGAAEDQHEPATVHKLRAGVLPGDFVE